MLIKTVSEATAILLRREGLKEKHPECRRQVALSSNCVGVTRRVAVVGVTSRTVTGVGRNAGTDRICAAAIGKGMPSHSVAYLGSKIESRLPLPSLNQAESSKQHLGLDASTSETSSRRSGICRASRRTTGS